MHRGWMDNAVLADNEPFSRREAWCWLIESARYDDGEEWINGGNVTVRRGQLCKAYRYIAKAWKWDESKVRRFCRMLEKAMMIRCGTAAGQALVTICNYDIYQADSCGDAAATDASPPRHRRGTAAPTAAKEKEDKEINNLTAHASAHTCEDPSDGRDWFDRLGWVDKILVLVWRQAGTPDDKILFWLTTTNRKSRDKVSAWLKLGLTPQQVAEQITAIFDQAETSGRTIGEPWSYLDKALPKVAEKVKSAEGAKEFSDRTPWKQRAMIVETRRTWDASWGKIENAPPWVQDICTKVFGNGEPVIR